MRRKKNRKKREKKKNKMVGDKSLQETLCVWGWGVEGGVCVFR